MKSVQIERRRRRAAEESFDIRKLDDDAIYGRFEVQSSSGKAYGVAIRDLSAPGANGCSCPDYAVNQLGTCKHIEAVFLHLKREAGAQFRRAALTPPPFASVFLAYGESVTVEARRPLKPHPAAAAFLDSHFDFRGRFRGDPVSHFPEFEEDLAGLPEPARQSIRVADEVREHLAYERALRATAVERSRFLAAIESGQQRFDPLLEPLYPFQVQGALFLAFGREALLADEMGLGKTVQAIAAAIELRRREPDFRRALVVCPASLKRQWAREIERFTGEPAVILEGPDRESRLYPKLSAFFAVASYEVAVRDLPRLKELAPDVLVLDEAQRIKNWRTRTAKAVKEIPRRAAFVLMGTPIEADLDAVYSIVQFLDQRRLGPLWRFNERYFRFDGRGRLLGYRNVDELKRRLDSIYLRRTKNQVRAELPDLISNTYAVALSPEARRRYDEARSKALALLELAALAPLDPEQSDRLDGAFLAMREACVRAAPEPDGSRPPKLAELAAILEETILASGGKAVVFAETQKLTTEVCRLLDALDVSHVHFHAGVPEEDRAALVDLFATEPGCRVFVSTELGSIGLNLQVADLVINLDQPWSNARRNQRVGRAYRLGRAAPVQLVNLVAEETLEEAVPHVGEIDRALLRRFGGPDKRVALSWEIKGRSIRDALADLLIAPPRRFPKRKRAPAPVLPPPRTPSLFQAPRLKALKERLGEAAGLSVAAAFEADGVIYAVADEALPELFEGKPVRALVDRPEPPSPEPAGPVSLEVGHELAIARSMLRASFPREALGRLARAVEAVLGEGEDPPADRLARQIAGGRLELESAGLFGLILTLREARSEPEEGVVRSCLERLEALLGLAETKAQPEEAASAKR